MAPAAPRFWRRSPPRCRCPLDNVTVLGADTDSSPYDSGSYASSTTYVTGKAVEQCAEQLKQKICQVGAGLLGLDERAVVFAGDAVTRTARMRHAGADCRSLPVRQQYGWRRL